VVRKLRERGEPILLFGETDYEAYVRLKKLETLEPDGKKVKIVKKKE
jgi:pre-mRNA-splicing factor 18